MKRVIVVCFFICTCNAIYAQLGVKADGSVPISSAQLEVQSTNRAFYPPRMTTAQKNAISSTQAGAVVYDTDLKTLSYYNGSAWVSTSVKAIANGTPGDYQLGRMLQSITSSGANSSDCVVDASGNFYLIGTYLSTLAVYNFDGTTPLTLGNAGSRESFIAKYSPAGVLLWAARLGGTGNDDIADIAVDATGITVVGSFSSQPMVIYNGRANNATSETSWGTLGASATDNFVVRYNTSGTVQWAARATVHAYLPRLTSDGTHVYVCFTASNPTIYNGRTNSGAGETSWGSLSGTYGYVVKFAISTGAVAWVLPTRATSTNLYADDIAVFGTNLYVLYDSNNVTFNSAISTAGSVPTSWGTLNPLVGGDSDAFVESVNASTGAINWVARVGSGSGNQWGSALVVDGSGNLYVSCVGRNGSTFGIYPSRTSSASAETAWGGLTVDGENFGMSFLVKYNSTGDIQWATHLHSSLVSTTPINGTGLAVDAQSNVYVAGTYMGTLINAYHSKSTGSASQTLAQTAPIVSSGSVTRGYFAKFNSLGKLEWLDRTSGTESTISHIAVSPNANAIFGIGLATSVAPLLLGTQSVTVTASGGDIFFFKYNQGNQ
jgi:hypothetical protein